MELTNDQRNTRQASFTRHGILRGARLALPIAVGVFPFGMTFGVLARQAGMSLIDAGVMSGSVFAGSAQFAVLGLWSYPLPLWSIILTTAVVNLRYVLMGASLAPWFKRLKPLQVLGSAFFMTDETWAMLVRELDNGTSELALMLGSGLTLFPTWVGSTLLGYIIGWALPDPARWGLDFALPAVFLVLLAGMWKGKQDILPWITAAIVAGLTAIWLPGKWYILAGGLSGGIVGGIRHDR